MNQLIPILYIATIGAIAFVSWTVGKKEANKSVAYVAWALAVLGLLALLIGDYENLTGSTVIVAGLVLVGILSWIGSLLAARIISILGAVALIAMSAFIFLLGGWNADDGKGIIASGLLVLGAVVLVLFFFALRKK